MQKKIEIILKTLLREFVKEYTTRNKNGSEHEENYCLALADDPAYRANSVYVPDDTKKKINKWANDMGLSLKKKK